MVNKQIEREEVLKPCIDLCKKLDIQGHILQYRRLDVFDKTHIEGSPDIEIFLPRDGYLWILMAECKKPIGGELSPGQRAYRDKYCRFRNVIYVVITEVGQLNKVIHELSDYGTEKMEEFKDFCL